MLKEKLMEDLKQSMKDKNVVRKNVVQMVRAAILQVEKDNGIEMIDAAIDPTIGTKFNTNEIM